MGAAVISRVASRIFVTFALCVLASPGHAQVNVEPFRDQLDGERVGGRVRASVASYAGNTQGTIFGGAGLVGLRGDSHLAYLAVTGDYTRLNGVVSVAKWFGHLRHSYEITPRTAWEQYGQVESDRFRRVTLRKLIGTGPRVALLRSLSTELWWGSSYMLEHTDLDTQATGGRGEGIAHRFSNYLSFTLDVHERILLSSVTYAQPRFDRPSDWVLLSVNSAEFSVTPLLQSRLDITMRYESVTPADVNSPDLELRSALEVVF
jgi:hypothetical protein